MAQLRASRSKHKVAIVSCPDHTPKEKGLVAFATFFGTVRKISNETSHPTEVIIVHRTIVSFPDHMHPKIGKKFRRIIYVDYVTASANAFGMWSGHETIFSGDHVTQYGNWKRLHNLASFSLRAHCAINAGVEKWPGPFSHMILLQASSCVIMQGVTSSVWPIVWPGR